MDPQRPIPPKGPKKESWFDLCRISMIWAKMSKLALGTIKNGSAASDLLPEGPKKERWVDLCNGGQTCQKSTSGLSKMDPQRPIYLTRVRKKRVGQFH